MGISKIILLVLATLNFTFFLLNIIYFVKDESFFNLVVTPIALFAAIYSLNEFLNK